MNSATHRVVSVVVAAGICFGASYAEAQAPAAADTARADTVAQVSVRQEAKSAAQVIGDFLGSLFSLSAGSLRTKSFRILVIVVIWLIASLVMRLVKTVNRWIVYSEWGPFKYVSTQHQRAMTINSLFINLVRYAVYLTAIGYILRELGVNYKAYLASLSVIGIAVGFGSQGLVQDVVTGFFLLFENPFSVGDMVEISGQFGVVEEIGLRSTRLKNYFGEIITFPNRNIAVVGRFAKGAVEACVDVAVANQEATQTAAKELAQIGKEMAKQFKEVILGTPEVLGSLSLETGELFVRLRAKFWPQQQWVIEGQLVPRIREIFKRDGIDIPGDRVVFFYHFPGRKR